MTRTLVPFLVLLAGCETQTFDDVVVYEDRASFLAAADIVHTVGFESDCYDRAVGNGVYKDCDTQGMTLATEGSGILVEGPRTVDWAIQPDSNVASVNAFERLRAIFDTPHTAAGFELVVNTATRGGVLIEFENGDAGSAEVELQPGTKTFVGVTADQPMAIVSWVFDADYHVYDGVDEVVAGEAHDAGKVVQGG